MLDKYGRNIDYMRVSITDRCNLRCIYCMPENGVAKKEHKDIITFEQIHKIVKAAGALGIRKVRYTGGEPLVRKGIVDLINKTSRINGIEEIAITTNGILLEEMAEDLKRAGLTRANISLDSLNKEKYKNITRGGDLSKVFSAIEKCLKIGLAPLKINTVLMKGINDDEIKSFIELTRELPVSIRFIELMPIGEAVNLNTSMVNSDEIIKSYSELYEIKDLSNSVARLYKLKNAKGTVGFISPLSCKFCSNCNRIRLTSSGTIKPCLHSEEEIDIKNYTGDDLKLMTKLKESIIEKPQEHHLEKDKESKSKKMMFQVGG